MEPYINDRFIMFTQDELTDILRARNERIQAEAEPLIYELEEFFTRHTAFIKDLLYTNEHISRDEFREHDKLDAEVILTHYELGKDLIWTCVSTELSKRLGVGISISPRFNYDVSRHGIVGPLEWFIYLPRNR